MSLVRLQGVHRYYGAHHVLGPIDLEVHEDDRIGVIGPNGSGKSTLLRLLAQEPPDEGQVVTARGVRIGLLRQDAPIHETRTLREFVETAFERLDAMEARLAQLEERMGDTDVQADPNLLERVMASYQREMAAFEQGGGYERNARLHATLQGLGFSENQFDQPVNTMSGGEQARAQLARVLLGNPDLLLLDEPTNHLDLSSTQWLQNFLTRYPKAFVLVSHDRFLLDAVPTRIWEVEGTTVVSYPGNYTASRVQAVARKERMAKDFQADQEERLRLEAFVRKWSAGTRAAQAKSRRRRLEKMEEAPPPPQDAPKASFTVKAGPRSERRVLTLEDVAVGYDGQPLLQGVDVEVTRGSRIAVAGPNGSGKSTLIRVITGQLEPLKGRVDLGRGVSLGYFSQTRVDLNPSNTVLEEALEAKHQLLGEARSFLARFLFQGDDVDKPVAALSGGEQSRLALAKLLLKGGNFLILDEPTNHLDIPMREALEEAFEQYEGTLIFITHDRALMAALADEVWWIEDGSMHVIDRGYEGLLGWLEAREAVRETTGSEGDQAKRGGKRGFESAQSDKSRKRRLEQELAAKRRRLEEIESEIERLDSELSLLETQLIDPETYRDADKARRLTEEDKHLRERMLLLEDEWSQLVEFLDEKSG